MNRQSSLDAALQVMDTSNWTGIEALDSEPLHVRFPSAEEVAMKTEAYKGDAGLVMQCLIDAPCEFLQMFFPANKTPGPRELFLFIKTKFGWHKDRIEEAMYDLKKAVM